MKKSLLTLAALLCMSVANAQLVGGYKATTKQDISIKGGTVINSNIAPADLPATVILSDASSNEWNGTSGKGFPIGFEFPFNGKNFSYFGVDALGLIRLSETEDMKMKNSNYFCSQSDEKFDNIIFCYNQSAQSYLADNEAGYEPTTISYKTTEDALVVEWKNLAVNASKWSTDLIGTYTMQIYLMKDGTIKYRFAGLSEVGQNPETVTMGLRATDDDYLCFSDLGATTSSYASTVSFALSPVVDGYTLTLNTPGPTVTPTAQPTNLQAEVSSQYGDLRATMTFDKAEGVDKYLMVISKGAPSALPEDGKTYTAGDSIGNAKVVIAGLPGRWGDTAYGLENDADYTVTVYAYNSFGTEGPKYNTVDPLQTSFSTAPAAPGEMKVISTDATTVKLSVAPNAKGQKVYVVCSTKTANPGNTGNRAEIGNLDAALNVGDKLTADSVEAGTLVYFGEAGEFEVTGLTPSTSYYFIAYTYKEEAGMFSLADDFSQVWTSTNIQVPYELNLADAPDSEAPGGWVSTPAGFNDGFYASDNYSKVDSQTEGNRIFICQNNEKDSAYKLTSPVIELTADNKISLDWHVHIMAGRFVWFQTANLYDEWYEDDVLEFVLYVDGEKVSLKKYDEKNPAPINDAEKVVDEYETYSSALDWHSETFDLSAYAGKKVQFGVEWLGANSSTLYFGLENIKVTGNAPATGVKSLPVAPSANNGLYNLNGQKVDAANGVLIQNSKKFVNK